MNPNPTQKPEDGETTSLQIFNSVVESSRHAISVTDSSSASVNVERQKSASSKGTTLPISLILGVEEALSAEVELDPDDPRIAWRLQGLAELIIDQYLEDLKCKQQ